MLFGRQCSGAASDAHILCLWMGPYGGLWRANRNWWMGLILESQYIQVDNTYNWGKGIAMACYNRQHDNASDNYHLKESLQCCLKQCWLQAEDDHRKYINNNEVRKNCLTMIAMFRKSKKLQEDTKIYQRDLYDTREECAILKNIIKQNNQSNQPYHSNDQLQKIITYLLKNQFVKAFNLASSQVTTSKKYCELVRVAYEHHVMITSVQTSQMPKFDDLFVSQERYGALQQILSAKKPTKQNRAYSNYDLDSCLKSIQKGYYNDEIGRKFPQDLSLLFKDYAQCQYKLMNFCKDKLKTSYNYNPKLQVLADKVIQKFDQQNNKGNNIAIEKQKECTCRQSVLSVLFFHSSKAVNEESQTLKVEEVVRKALEEKTAAIKQLTEKVLILENNEKGMKNQPKYPQGQVNNSVVEQFQMSDINKDQSLKQVQEQLKQITNKFRARQEEVRQHQYQLTTTINSYSNKIKELERTNQQLRTQLDTKNQSIKQDKQKTARKINECETINRQLTCKVSQLQSEKYTLEHSLKLDKDEKQYDTAITQSLKQQAHQVPFLKKNISELNHQLQQRSITIVELTDQNQKLTKHNQALTKHISELNTQDQELASQNNELINQNEKLKNIVSDMNSKLQAEETEAKQIEQEADSTQNQLQQLRAELKKLKPKFEILQEESKEEKRKLNKQKELLTQKDERIEQVEKELTTANTDIAKLNIKIEKLEKGPKNHLDKPVSANEEKQQQYSSKIHALESRIKQLETEDKELKTNLQSSITASQQFEENQAKLKETQSENERLVEQIEQAKRNCLQNHISKVESDELILKNNEQHQKDSRDQATPFQDHISLADFDKAIGEKNHYIESLEQQLKQNTSQSSQLTNVNNKLSIVLNEKESLASDLHEIKEKVAEKETDIEKLKGQIENLKDQIVKTNNQKQLFEQQKASLEQSLSKSTLECQQIKKEMAEKQIIISDLKNQHQNELFSIRKSIDQHQQTVNNLTEENKTLKTQKESLQRKVKEMIEFQKRPTSFIEGEQQSGASKKDQKKEVYKLMKEKVDLSEEVKQLKKKIKQFEANSINSQQESPIKQSEEMTNSQKGNNPLTKVSEEQLETLKREQQKEMEKITQKNVCLSKEVEQLKQKIKELQANSMSNLKGIQSRQTEVITPHKTPTSLIEGEEQQSGTSKKEQKKQMYKIMKEKVDLAEEIKQLKKKIRQLQGSSILNQKDGQIKQLEKTCQTYEKTQKSNQNTIEEMKKSIAQSKDAKMSAQSTLQQKNTTLKQENDKLIQQLKEKQQESAKQIEKLNNEVDNMKLKLQQTQNSKNDLEEQLKVKVQKEKQEEHQRELKNQNVQSLEDVIQLRDQLKQQLSNLKESQSQLQKSNQTLQQELQQSKNLNTKIQEQLTSSNMKLQQAQSQLTDKTTQIATLTHQAKDLNTRQFNFQQQSERYEQRYLQLQKLYNQFKNGKKDYQPYLQGFLFEHYPIQKEYCLSLLEERLSKRVVKTRLLYRYDSEAKNNLHYYVDGYADLLFVAQIQSDHIIIGFTKDPFSSEKSSEGYGMIANLKNRKYFELNAKNPKSRAISYDNFFLIFGNAELRLKTGDNILFSNFGIMNNYYDCKGEKVDAIMGQGKQRELPLETYELYQLVFE